MFAIFAGAVIWWLVARRLGIPTRVLWVMLVVVYLAIVAAHFVLPATSPLMMALGGDVRVWGVIGLFAAMIAGYGRGLAYLRARSQSANQTPPPNHGTFSDTELDRYARHIVMREIGGVGQKKIKNARVLVIGAGGLGSPALQYLAAAGVGTIGVIDDDVVDNSNLQRQVIHQDAAIGMPKVFSAQKMLQAQNPYVQIPTYYRRLTDDISDDLFADYDIIVEGSDNFETRYLANATCVKLGKPMVSGALSQWEGQVSVFHPAKTGPCYQCVFPTKPADGLAPSCAEAGVFAPLPGVIGSIMAGEVIKLIIGEGSALIGEMMIYDALYGEIRKFKSKQNKSCEICSKTKG